MASKLKGEGVPDAELVQAAAFRTALRRFLRRTETMAAQAGLTSQRYDLLLMIRSAHPTVAELRVTELCELLQLQQTAVTELVKRTEEAGLIARRPSAEDGRGWLLLLTADGEERMMRVFDALRNDREALADAFAELDNRFQATA